MKKFILTILIVCMSFSFNASAKKMEIVKDIKPQGEFYVYGEQSEKVADIFGMDNDALEDYCHQNGVSYLAVNKDNTKQIKVTHSITEFSESVNNISGLENDSITVLIPDITGIENSNGEIINKNGQKFVKTQFITTDSGGEYILTQYFTVANSMNIVLSFYTEATADKNYIDETFETFSSPLFISEKEQKTSSIGYVILVAAIIFGIACVAIIFTIIRDIKKERKEIPETEDTEQNDN